MSSSLDIPAIATQLFFNGFRFRLLRAMRRSGEIKTLSAICCDYHQRRTDRQDSKKYQKDPATP